MRTFLLSLALICTLAGIAHADPASFFIHNGDRMVFYGDSITDTEWYPTLVQTFILTRYPAWRNEFLNRGQSGDNTSSLKRFARDVVAVKPNVFTFMMGYNDGGYRPYTSASQEQFLANVERSVAMAREGNPAIRAMLVSPTPSELTISNDNRWVSHDWYPYHLLMFAQGEERLAKRLDTGFVDMTTLYGQTLGLGRVLAGPTFALSRDGVHPQTEGHTFIAYHLLRGMGAGAELTTVSFDGKAGTLIAATHCKVSDVKIADGVISFSRTCDALPYPTPEVARPFSFLVQLDDTINDDRLIVSGLTAPSYALWVDEMKIAELPASELAEGVNLSRFPATPMYRQSMAVMAAVREKDLLDCRFWRNYITSGKADANGNPLDNTSRGEIEAALLQLKAARATCYTLNTPKAHTIKLQPLAQTIARYHDQEQQDLNQAFLQAELTPVKIDWNQAVVVDGGATNLTISNPGSQPKSGTVCWQCPAGWTINPPESTFSVAGGKRVTVPFSVSRIPGGKVAPAPAVTLSWHWDKDWPYPMTRTLELDMAPQWTISKVKQPVTIDGNLDDWAGATSFTLDDPYYIDAQIPGKRAAWTGPDDLSVKYAMQWDEQALYIAAVVHDDEHIQHEQSYMMWSQDLLHFGAFSQEKGKADGWYEYGFGAYADKDAVVAFKGSSTVADIRFKSLLDDVKHTCTYEVAIPWSRLAPFVPAEGKTFRSSFVIGDADYQPGKGFNYLAWTPGISYGKNYNDFATIIFGQ